MVKVKVIVKRANKGGPGSGNWGHSGRPGSVGGSAAGSGKSGVAGSNTDPNPYTRGLGKAGMATPEQAAEWKKWGDESRNRDAADEPGRGEQNGIGVKPNGSDKWGQKKRANYGKKLLVKKPDHPDADTDRTFQNDQAKVWLDSARSSASKGKVVKLQDLGKKAGMFLSYDDGQYIIGFSNGKPSSNTALVGNWSGNAEAALQKLITVATNIFPPEIL